MKSAQKGKSCEAAAQSASQAAPAPSSILDGFQVAQRSTRMGAACRLPIIYRCRCWLLVAAPLTG